MNTVKLNNSAPIKVHGLPEGGGSGGSGIETKFLIFKDHYDAATQKNVPLLDISFQELSEIYTKYTNHQINLVVLLESENGVFKTQLNQVQMIYSEAQPEYDINYDSISISASGLNAVDKYNTQIVFIDEWNINDDGTITYSPIDYVILQQASS